MVCQESDTKNEKLDTEDRQLYGQSIKLSKKKIIIIAIVAAMIMVVVMAHNVIKKNTSSEVVAQKYFEEIVSANWDKAYEYLELSPDSWTRIL